MIHGVINSAATGCRYGDRIWTLKCIIEDKYCIYPTQSVVRNWGVDGSGQHCGNYGKNNIYVKQEMSLDSLFNLCEIEIESCNKDKDLKNFLYGNFINRIKRVIKSFIDIITMISF